MNGDGGAARRYHQQTDHSARSVADWDEGPPLDPATRPVPYKLYRAADAGTPAEPIPLPSDFSLSDRSALEDIAASGAGQEGAGERIPLLPTLARLLLLSNGVTRRVRLDRLGGREFAFRAAPCTGALYHVELCLACGELPDLQAGLYHYGAHDDALRRLRAGDVRQALVEATGGEAAIARAPVVVVATSTFGRNAWKYGERAYRHAFWDTGTMLPNTLALAAAVGLPARVVLGFADGAVNGLVGADGEREAAVALVAIGHTDFDPPAPLRSLPPLELEPEPATPGDDLPEIRRVQAASSLASGAAAAAWRGAAPPAPMPPPRAPLRELRPLPPEALPTEPIEAVIRRRGSTRRFSREPIPAAHLATALDRALRPLPGDFLAPDGPPPGDLYLIVNAVDGLAPGSYVRHRDGALEPLAEGDFRQRAFRLALEQDLAADAAVNVFVLTDLEPLLARYGDRGYRVAQLAAALTCGRLWLAAYALGLGATGLTFYDDEVVGFFSPHAAGKKVMFEGGPPVLSCPVPVRACGCASYRSLRGLRAGPYRPVIVRL